MQFQFKLTIGETEFTFVDTAETHADFFQKASFYASLPTKGPNGEDDLKLVHRTTRQGHNYYSLVSEKADQEYKFGQSQQKPGTLFGKGWEQLYHGENDGAVDNGQNVGIGNVGIGQQNTMPGIQNLPQQGIGVPQQQMAPQQNVQQQPVQQQPVQQQTQAAPQQQVPQNQQVQNQQIANDVFQQFGLNQN